MERESIDWNRYVWVGVLSVVVALCLGVVCMGTGELPPAMLEGQKEWLGGCLLVGLPLMGGIFIFASSEVKEDFADLVVPWLFIFFGAVEVVWGLWQVYGLVSSNHSLFALTGSFYNPGPYSGYLAMVFPFCVHEWLKRRLDYTVPYYSALAMIWLIICVLPAGMSRSAWVAAALSSAYVYAMRHTWEIKEWFEFYPKKAKAYVVAGTLLGCLAIGGMYLMKKDSADGRLLMWKIAARAIAQNPWEGYGWDAVPAVYGQMQEAYFAEGNYTETEERVAGTPKYVFNEYLQVAMAWGIPVLLLGMCLIAICFWIGHRKRNFGACGALIALLLFACSSYPLQFPAFVAALVILLYACVAKRVPFDHYLVGPMLILITGGAMYLCAEEYNEAGKRWDAYGKWNKERIYYQSGSYGQAADRYADYFESMKWNELFLFEYGHALHKANRPSCSNKVLEEALKVSGDPMILNIMGKNEQAMGNFGLAEEFFLRSINRLPGRIYPYYLLAKLYAEPKCFQPGKLKQAAEMVLTKEPKVQSTAIKEMRQEVKKMMEKIVETE